MAFEIGFDNEKQDLLVRSTLTLREAVAVWGYSL